MAGCWRGGVWCGGCGISVLQPTKTERVRLAASVFVLDLLSKPQLCFYRYLNRCVHQCSICSQRCNPFLCLSNATVHTFKSTVQLHIFTKTDTQRNVHRESLSLSFLIPTSVSSCLNTQLIDSSCTDINKFECTQTQIAFPFQTYIHIQTHTTHTSPADVTRQRPLLSQSRQLCLLCSQSPCCSHPA